MALNSLFSKQKFSYQDPGTGTAYSPYSKRVINKNGSFNVVKSGLKPTIRNTFQYLIGITWARFLTFVFVFLFIVNAFFAMLYVLIGVEHIGIREQSDSLTAFLDACLFSFQTFTTVGYGVLHPVGRLAGVLSAVEATIGWMCFALITGLLYGRFSKPSALLMYSKRAIISPYKDGLNSLQFRIANMRHSILMEMEATVLLVHVQRGEDGQGVTKRNFIPLQLERKSILFLPLNWTIVHPITKESPLYGKTKAELKEADVEILIMIKGFDDTFSNMVHSRHSYRIDEIEWEAKFVMMYETQENGDIQLFFDKLHDYTSISLHDYDDD